MQRNIRVISMLSFACFFFLTGCSSVYQAVNNEDMDSLEKAVSEGGDVNYQVLEDAYTPLILAILKGNTQMVKFLLDAGADPNLSQRMPFSKEDIIKNTPLIAAVKKGYYEIVKLLLKAGADPDLATGANNTPLIWAAAKNYPDIISLLLKNGANPDSKERKFGETALMLAVIKGHKEVIQNLLKGGASPNLAAIFHKRSKNG